MCRINSLKAETVKLKWLGYSRLRDTPNDGKNVIPIQVVNILHS